MRRIRTAWSRPEPVATAPAAGPLIAESWARCRAAGVDPSARDYQRVSAAELRRRQAGAAPWLAVAREHAGHVSALLGDLPHALALADRDGVLLHVAASGAVPKQSGLTAGVDWSEAKVGTSGVGTALATGNPVVVAGAEHYRTALRGYTCTAAPLHAPDGAVLGVVTLVTTAPAGMTDRLALVRYLAHAVERELAEAAHVRGALASTTADVERARLEVLEREEQFRVLADTIPHLAWMADARGNIFWYNRRWFDYTGLTPEEAQGWGWRRAHHPDHVERVVAGITAAWESGAPWEDTFPLRAADGGYRWFLSRAHPIRDAQGRVVRWFGTNTDITVQIGTEQALRDAQQQLERLCARAQSAVAEREEAVAVVSHDLRAPLNVLGMAAHLLLEPQVSAEQKQAQAEAISRVVAQMTRLVGDVLDLTRARAGHALLEPAMLDVGQLLRGAVEQASPLAAAAGVRLQLATPGASIRVRADETRILQVLANLLGNAIEHTAAGGTITLSVGAAAGAVCFEVRDTGAGIPPDELPHVFERYWQGASARGRGAGLGLAICKEVVEAHGGVIGVTSAPGQGSTFSFTLPADT